jgi:hypothetical protein
MKFLSPRERSTSSNVQPKECPWPLGIECEIKDSYWLSKEFRAIQAYQSIFGIPSRQNFSNTGLAGILRFASREAS